MHKHKYRRIDYSWVYVDGDIWSGWKTRFLFECTVAECTKMKMRSFRGKWNPDRTPLPEGQ